MALDEAGGPRSPGRGLVVYQDGLPRRDGAWRITCRADQHVVEDPGLVERVGDGRTEGERSRRFSLL